jgi:phosphoenolpyruvate synthase/pyruvate phosphate dikinase
MDGLPVTIRLLDPPLHEFLPHEGHALAHLCNQVRNKAGLGVPNQLGQCPLSKLGWMAGTRLSTAVTQAVPG